MNKLWSQVIQIETPGVYGERREIVRTRKVHY